MRPGGRRRVSIFARAARALEPVAQAAAPLQAMVPAAIQPQAEGRVTHAPPLAKAAERWRESPSAAHRTKHCPERQALPAPHPLRAAHRIFPASGGSDHASGQAAPQIRVRLLALRLRPRPRWRRRLCAPKHPAKTKTALFRTAAEASSRAVQNLFQTDPASSHHWLAATLRRPSLAAASAIGSVVRS